MLTRIIALIIALFSFQLTFTQNYNFVPTEFRLLSQDEMDKVQIIIKPGILLYNGKGEALPMSQLSLMTNQEYRPRFFVDTNYDLKAIVFENINDNPLIISKTNIEETAFVTGEKALDFIAYDANENPIKLSELQGKVVVLNFWFIKCGPCVAEMPALNNLKRRFENDDVVFLAITFDKADMVEQFLQTKEFVYKMLPDASHVIQMYGVQSFPTNIVIDKKGHVTLKETGYRTNITEVLSRAISKSLRF